jgi:hypothetical protein
MSTEFSKGLSMATPDMQAMLAALAQLAEQTKAMAG